MLGLITIGYSESTLVQSTTMVSCTVEPTIMVLITDNGTIIDESNVPVTITDMNGTITITEAT